MTRYQTLGLARASARAGHARGDDGWEARGRGNGGSVITPLLAEKSKRVVDNSLLGLGNHGDV